MPLTLAMSDLSDLGENELNLWGITNTSFGVFSFICRKILCGLLRCEKYQQTALKLLKEIHLLIDVISNSILGISC
jgi:hypothetical protein